MNYFELRVHRYPIYFKCKDFSSYNFEKLECFLAINTIGYISINLKSYKNANLFTLLERYPNMKYIDVNLISAAMEKDFFQTRMNIDTLWLNTLEHENKKYTIISKFDNLIIRSPSTTINNFLKKCIEDKIQLKSINIMILYNFDYTVGFEMLKIIGDLNVKNVYLDSKLLLIPAVIDRSMGNRIVGNQNDYYTMIAIYKKFNNLIKTKSEITLDVSPNTYDYLNFKKTKLESLTIKNYSYLTLLKLYKNFDGKGLKSLIFENYIKTETYVPIYTKRTDSIYADIKDEDVFNVYKNILNSCNNLKFLEIVFYVDNDAFYEFLEFLKEREIEKIILTFNVIENQEKLKKIKSKNIQLKFDYNESDKYYLNEEVNDPSALLEVYEEEREFCENYVDRTMLYELSDKIEEDNDNRVKDNKKEKESEKKRKIDNVIHEYPDNKSKRTEQKIYVNNIVCFYMEEKWGIGTILKQLEHPDCPTLIVKELYGDEIYFLNVNMASVYYLSSNKQMQELKKLNSTIYNKIMSLKE